MDSLLAQSSSSSRLPTPTRRHIKPLEHTPTAADSYIWEDWAELSHLDSASIDSLRTHKIAFGESVKQSFTPYLEGPVFITSDSLLNAYHVLFEASFRHLESLHQSKLKGNLEELLLRAKRNAVDPNIMDAERGRKALAFLQHVLGPAMVLQGSPLDIFDESLRADILQDLARIQKAEEQSLPAWLPPLASDPIPFALDFRRLKPTGFYAEDSKLAEYFRAVRWLQMVPFRAAFLEEMDALFLCGLSDFGYGAPSPGPDYSDLLGRGDTLTPWCFRFLLPTIRPRKSEHFDSRRAQFRSQFLSSVLGNSLSSSRVNSDLLLNHKPAERFEDLSFRLLDSHALPDASLLQRALDAELVPDGLLIPAALGDSFALGKLSPELRQFLHKGNSLMDSLAGSAENGGLGIRYYDTLAALSLPPDPAAPGFVRGDLWKLKSCQTILASTVQMRSALVLQSKEPFLSAGLHNIPPGFVEPNPEFFNRMHALVGFCHRAMSSILERHPEGVSEVLLRWLDLSDLCGSLEALAHKELRGQPWSRADEALIKGYGIRIAHLMGYPGNSSNSPEDDAPRWTILCVNPRTNTHIASAVGRPRLLHVLYPWNGVEIFCTGSVMQYYEFVDQQRRTNRDWRHLLDSPDAPPLPEWMRGAVPVPMPPRKSSRP